MDRYNKKKARKREFVVPDDADKQTQPVRFSPAFRFSSWSSCRDSLFWNYLKCCFLSCITLSSPFSSPALAKGKDGQSLSGSYFYFLPSVLTTLQAVPLRIAPRRRSYFIWEAWTDGMFAFGCLFRNALHPPGSASAQRRQSQNNGDILPVLRKQLVCKKSSTTFPSPFLSSQPYHVTTCTTIKNLVQQNFETPNR